MKMLYRMLAVLPFVLASCNATARGPLSMTAASSGGLFVRVSRCGAEDRYYLTPHYATRAGTVLLADARPATAEGEPIGTDVIWHLLILDGEVRVYK
jgi:hypothetical protein